MSDLLRVIPVLDKDIYWSFNNDYPVLRLVDPDDQWGRQERFDPFPCYSHDVESVKAILQLSFATFKVGHPVNCFVLSHETEARWNGYCDIDYDWNQKTEEGRSRPIKCFRIMLNGKRTPLHPAMTRYVVSHEYGHAVENWLRERLGFNDSDGQMRDLYKTIRPGNYETSYGARQHHTNLGELIANDFRILLAGYETEFWPHPGYPHPFDVSGLKDWWLEMREKHGQ